MTYNVNVYKFIFSMDDHLFRIRKAEKFKNLWKVSIYLLLGSIAIYLWMALVGMGSGIISEEGAVTLPATEYEQMKILFVMGRVLFSILFAAFILFVPSLLFFLLTGIPYQKLIIMQQVVLVAMLLERLIWIPLAVFAGLEWYVSPLSLGVITSYITDLSWVVYFFGAISIFQLWIMWFQVRYLRGMSGDLSKVRLWLYVTALHVIGWLAVALTRLIETNFAGGWFG